MTLIAMVVPSGRDDAEPLILTKIKLKAQKSLSLFKQIVGL
jgi:hypothetical protein